MFMLTENQPQLHCLSFVFLLQVHWCQLNSTSTKEWHVKVIYVALYWYGQCRSTSHKGWAMNSTVHISCSAQNASHHWRSHSQVVSTYFVQLCYDRCSTLITFLLLLDTLIMFWCELLYLQHSLIWTLHRQMFVVVLSLPLLLSLTLSPFPFVASSLCSSSPFSHLLCMSLPISLAFVNLLQIHQLLGHHLLHPMLDDFFDHAL